MFGLGKSKGLNGHDSGAEDSEDDQMGLPMDLLRIYELGATTGGGTWAVGTDGVKTIEDHNDSQGRQWVFVRQNNGNMRIIAASAVVRVYKVDELSVGSEA